MGIYTRQGDEGDTDLADGTRVSKASARVEAYGEVDEANSAVGFARAGTDDPYLNEVLGFIQQRLMNCSSTLATPAREAARPGITDADIRALEKCIDRMTQAAGSASGFVIEGGCETAARCHLARAILRRAERRVVTLAAADDVDPQVLAFLNRSSDVLYAAARFANASADVAEEKWDQSAPEPQG